MLITFIVTAMILPVLYILINLYNKKAERSNYEFSTGASKSLFIFSHALFCVPYLVIATDIILYFFVKDQTTLWCIYGIFLFFAIFGLFFLYTLYFTYEAISGDKVYVHRYFKVKIFNVNDIRRISFSKLIVGFYGIHNKCLFLADGMTKGIKEFINLIDERKSSSIDEEAVIAEENAVLKKLGREYKASYNERRKKFIRNFPVLSIVFWSAIMALMFFTSANTYYIVAPGLLLAVVLALVFFTALSTMKKELSEDDLTLGNRHKFKNKKVKGASKNTFIAVCACSICLMFLGALLLLPLMTIYHERPNYGEFTPVTGKLEYYRENNGKSSYIAIGLYDIPTEYRLYSTYLDELNYTFFDEVKVGDTITILIDNDEDREFSIRGVSKNKWNNFYYLAVGSKEYFTYEAYINSLENSNRRLWIIVGVGITMLVASAAGLIIGYFVCKKRRQEEDIVIYKS